MLGGILYRLPSTYPWISNCQGVGSNNRQLASRSAYSLGPVFARGSALRLTGPHPANRQLSLKLTQKVMFKTTQGGRCEEPKPRCPQSCAEFPAAPPRGIAAPPGLNLVSIRAVCKERFGSLWKRARKPLWWWNLANFVQVQRVPFFRLVERITLLGIRHAPSSQEETTNGIL